MNDCSKLVEKIADEILKDKDNVKAIEFTTVIGKLLRENGVTPICTEYVADGCFDNKFGYGYKCCFEKLDFTEHDKVFEDKIAELQEECVKLHNQLMETERDMQEENEKLMHNINEITTSRSEWIDKAVEWQQKCENLDSKETETCEKEPKVSGSAPSIEWYENRHQSNCIEINRLNTTIDVLIHKVEYLRQFAGLE